MIAPTLACANYLNLQQDIEALEKAGVDIYHIDIMDGNFVPNVCLNYDLMAAVQTISSTPMDVHLMVINPMDHFKILSKYKIEYLSAHIEALKEDAQLFIDNCHERGIKAGLVLSPEDSVEKVIPYLKDIDYILVMFVRPGFSGQSLDKNMLEKVRLLKKLRDESDYHFLIQGDGGIGWDNIEEVIAAGVDISVAGMLAIFGQENLSVYDATTKFIEYMKKSTNDKEKTQNEAS